MKSLTFLLGLSASLALVPRLAAQSDEVQALKNLQSKVEKFMKESQRMQEDLASEIKKLQENVHDLKKQLKKDPIGSDDVEAWKAKLAAAEERARKAEQRAKEETQRLFAALKEARMLSARSEELQIELQEKIRKLEKEFLPSKDKDKEKDIPKLPMNDVPKGRIQGKIINVYPNNPNQVDIDLGSEDGLKNGQTMAVFRIVESRPTFICTLKLISVRPARSIAILIPPDLLKSVEATVGDSVSNVFKEGAAPK